MSGHRSSLRKPTAKSKMRPRWDLLEDRRLFSAGALDTTFGTNGQTINSFAAPHDFALPAAVLLQHNGDAVVVGSAGPGQASDTPASIDFALTRYTTAGKLDTTFGTKGVVFTDFSGGQDVPTGAALQSNGDIVVAGTNFSTNAFEFARYTTTGALDTTFGNHGRVMTNLGGFVQSGSVAIDSSGRIVVAGVSSGTPSDPSATLAVIRYQANGALDSSFGQAGVVTFTAGPAATIFTAGAIDNPTANGLAIESDGKLVVAGGTAAGDFYALRLTTTGALDSSFGSGGVSIVNMGKTDAATSVAFVSGGKIVLGGTSGTVSGNISGAFALARLNSNGSLDTTFGTNGKTTTAFAQPAIAYGMTIQLNGAILLSGTSISPNQGSNIGPARYSYSVLTRYTAAGKLDTTFNNTGELLFNPVDVTFDIGLSNAFGVAVQVDGKLVVASDEGETGSDSFVITRFQGDAVASVSGTVFNDANGNGKLDTGEAGQAAQRVYLDMNNNGVYDTGTDYYVNTDAHGNYTLATLAPGTYVVREVSPAGSQLTTPAAGAYTVTLAAGQNASGDNFGNQHIGPGVFDDTFGKLGNVISSFAPPHSSATPAALLLQHNGMSIVVNNAFVPNSSSVSTDIAIARYTTTGTLDPSFGTAGVVFTGFAGGTNSDLVTSAALQSDGKFIVAGESSGNIALARYTASGALDTTFGNQGRILTHLGSYHSEVTVDGSGRIIVAAFTTVVDLTRQLTVVRYLSNGKLDPTFGVAGVANLSSGPLANIVNGNPGVAALNSVAMEPDGKIVVAGAASEAGVFAARVTSTGALDTTFGAGGAAVVNFGGFDNATSLAFVAGGKILLGGNVTNSSGNGLFALTRLNSNGTLDTTFGTSGKTTTTIANSSLSATAMAVQLDGKIILAGSSFNNSTHADSSLLARYTANGILDTTFNGTGKVLYNTAGSAAVPAASDAYAVAVQLDGKVLVAGDLNISPDNPGQDNYVLTRFFGDAPITVSGTVFNDINSDGIQGTGEAGLGSRKLFIDLNNNGVFDSATDYYTVTDANGKYSFANLAPGTYVVREILPTGAKITAPAGGAYTLTLTAGQVVTGKNFGNH